mgnify:CR=1 FL=1
MQAVIICGGRGKRLMPITKNRPKILAPINGKPFVFYILDQLYNQGIKEVLFLTGYLGNKIEETVSIGNKANLKIKYMHGPAKWETGRRIWEAKKNLDKKFLILYSDNFTVFNLKKNLNLFKKKNIFLTLTIAPKIPGNLSISKNNLLTEYNNNRSKDLAYVEIGYMIVNKIFLFNQFENKNCCLSDLIKKISYSKNVNAMIQNSGYQSISDPRRLLLTEKYLRYKKIILLDRDGVINYKAPKGRYINKWSDFRFIKKTLNLLLKLSNNGYKFIVITNQAGVGRKITLKKDLRIIHQNMVKVLLKKGIKILRVYTCPHHWEDNCDCRKPKPALFYKASKRFNFRLDKTVFIGDDDRDMIAAKNAECKSLLWKNDNKTLFNKNLIEKLEEIQK